MAAKFKVPQGYILLPIIPTMDMLHGLRNPKWPETWERGKRMQLRYGLEVVPPECNIEIAAGCYEQLIEAAPPPPDTAVVPDRARLERALDALKAFQPGYERPDARARERLYATRNDVIHSLEYVLRGIDAAGVALGDDTQLLRDCLEGYESMLGRRPERIEKLQERLRARLAATEDGTLRITDCPSCKDTQAGWTCSECGRKVTIADGVKGKTE